MSSASQLAGKCGDGSDNGGGCRGGNCKVVLWLPVVASILVEWVPVVVWLGGWWLPEQVVARGCLWLVNCVPVVAGGCLWLPIGGTVQPWLPIPCVWGQGWE